VLYCPNAFTSVHVSVGRPVRSSNIDPTDHPENLLVNTTTDDHGKAHDDHNNLKRIIEIESASIHSETSFELLSKPKII
jgi:hypothetical protein